MTTVDRTEEQWGIRLGEGGGIYFCRDRAQALNELQRFEGHAPEVVCRTVTTAMSDWDPVVECQFTHAHTREWCGNRHCRES